MYSTNFTVANKNFCLSLHYNGNNSYLFVNGKEIINFKAKDSEIVPYPLCLEVFQKYVSPSNTHKTGLSGYIYDFSVDYWAIDKILDINKYLMKKNNIMEMFGFIKKVFVVAMTFFNLSNVNSLECVSMNNQECRTRTKIININNNEPVFYPFSIKVNKCSGSCNNINDPYAKLCVPDFVKNINVKVFNLMSWSNQTKHIEWYEPCKCKCRLDSSACNNKQRWNEDTMYTIHSIICCNFSSKCNNWQCFCLPLLVFKKEYYKLLLLI